MTGARHAVVLALPAMTLNSTDSSSSIFKNGKLKHGIYKIQNLCCETFLDVHHHSKQVCCRPAQNLEDGEGLVRLSPGLVVAHLTIKSGRSNALGLDTRYRRWDHLCDLTYRALGNVRASLSQGSLRSFVIR